MKKPAQRVGTSSGLSVNVSLQADIHGYALSAGALQARSISQRFAISGALAAALAELAYGSPETWRAAR